MFQLEQPDSKSYILYYSIYTKCSEKATLQRQKADWLSEARDSGK